MLDVQHLHFRFGQRTLLRDLSFKVDAGQMLHIKGPNGVGKTTLLSLILGLRTPQAGTIQWRDQNLVKGVCFAEHNALWMHLDPVSTLEFWYRLATGDQLSKTQLDPILDSWQLPSSVWLRRLACSRLSTGMKRKLSLIRLELLQPDFLILDEPMLGLDQAATQRLAAWIKDRLRHNKAGLIVSHDIDKLPIEDLRSLDLLGPHP